MKGAHKPSRWHDAFRIVVAVVLTIVMFAFDCYLLWDGLLGGGAFVSFLGISFAVGFVIAQWPRLSELSILGSSLKLRELTTEAEQAIESLKHGRLNLYRTAMNLTLRHPGGWGDRFSDGRVVGFLAVVDMIRDERLLPDLADEVMKNSNLLISAQFNGLSQFSHDTTNFDLRGVTPDELPTVFRAWAMQEGRDYVTTDPTARIATEVERLDRLLQVSREAQATRP